MKKVLLTAFITFISLLSYAESNTLTPNVAKKFGGILMWDGCSKNDEDKYDMGEFFIDINKFQIAKYGNSDLLRISFNQNDQYICIPIKNATYTLLENGIQISYPAQMRGYSNTLQVTDSGNDLIFNLYSTASSMPVMTQHVKMFYVANFRNDKFNEYSTTLSSDMLEIFVNYVKKYIKKGK